MSKFYSSLIINYEQFQNVHQLFRPRYNKEFFKRLFANADQIEAHIKRRCKGSAIALANYKFDDIKRDSLELVKLKERWEKIENFDENNSEHVNLRTRLGLVQDRLMPFVVAIPNRSSNQVPEEDVILEEVKSDFMEKQRLTKVLNYVKLSYINNCYSKSVVGPNSHYYFGIGAKLQLGLSDFFATELEKKDFIPVSGACLVKSALVEAVNSQDIKHFTTDPCRILSEHSKYTAMHLVEASRESLVAFSSTWGPRGSNTPVRLMISGAGYRVGSHWFDSDEKRVTQFETLHAMSLAPSIEQYSVKEYHHIRESIWDIYKQLRLPLRLVHCSLDSMQSHEYEAYRIDVWLPSRREWIQTCRISNYLDFITVRIGQKRGHIIDSMVYDGQALVAAIIENNQTANGKFIIPPVIGKHMISLTDKERSDYLRNMATSSPPCHEQVLVEPRRAFVLNNYEQRRSFTQRNMPFGHSKIAGRLGSKQRLLRKYTLCLVFIFSLFVDWKEVWIQYVPTPIKRFFYNYGYRVLRRLWWAIVYRGREKPIDLPFDEEDLSDYEKTMYQRRREHVEHYDWTGRLEMRDVGRNKKDD